MQYLRPLRVILFSVLVGGALFLSGCDSAGTNGDDESQNQAPTAEVTVSSSMVDIETQVTLDGSESSDPDGDDLTFTWTLSTPSNSSASLSDPSAEQPTFTPDVSGEYSATLEVSDGDASDTDDGVVTAESVVVEITSDITEDRTFTPEENYLVTSTVCVENSSTLTIEDGVTIEFESGTGLKVCGDGSALVANGTASDGITMTGTTEQAGFWQGLGINSSNQNNELSGVTIEYAGGNNLYTFVNGTAGLQLKEGSVVTITNSTIRNNANYGLSAQGSVDLSGFSDNTFQNNESTSMNLHALNMGTLDTGTSYGSHVRINNGSISGETITISSIAVPYRIAGVRQIDDGSDVTVEAGTTFEFESAAGLKVNGDATAFKAQGAQADSIRFTGVTKQKGGWKGVGFSSSNVNNELSHVVVEFAGGNNLYTFTDRANIQVNGGSELTLNNSLIQESDAYGLSSNDGASAVNESNNTYRRNASGARNF